MQATPRPNVTRGVRDPESGVAPPARNKKRRRTPDGAVAFRLEIHDGRRIVLA